MDVRKNKEIIERLEKFKHNALCRYESNQHKAIKQLKELKEYLSTDEYDNLYTELNHYNLGHIDIKSFGNIINDLINKYNI